jgi:hypothetical protein
MAFARANQLGEYQITYRAARISTKRLAMMIIMGVFLLVVLFGLYFLYLAYMTPNLNKRQAEKRLHFFENGFVVADANGPVHAFRWDTLTLYQAITVRYAYGVRVATNYEYRLIKPDRSEVKLTEFYEKPDEWGSLIQQQITRVQLPMSLARLQRREDLDFGPIVVNAGGITQGRKSMTWAEVQEIKVESGILHIRKAGKWLNWSGPAFQRIPNAYLLIGVVRTMISQTR